MKEKAGYKTTEFYLSVLAMVLGSLMASGALVEGSVWAKIIGAGITVLAALGYTASRAKVKANEKK